MTWMYVTQMVAALIVLSEALNKLERADLFDGQGGVLRRLLLCVTWLLRPWGWRRPRVVMVLKMIGWAWLSVGAAGSVLTPPTGPHVAVLAGFALLIVRSRLKEG
jgi:hypothetical protein